MEEIQLLVIAGFELRITRLSQSARKKSLGAINCNIFFLLADYDDGSTNSGDGGSCAGFSSELGDGCTISDDCSTITCNMEFAAGHQITFKLKVQR